MNVQAIRHQRTAVCPRCRAAAYCDRCGTCGACDFAAPDVDATKRKCSECGGTFAHERRCSATLRAARS